MGTVKHKIFGTAKIISRDETTITIEYDKSGKVSVLKFPEAFTSDLKVFEIDPELQREVDAIVNARKEAEHALYAEKEALRLKEKEAVSAAVTQARRTVKKPAKVKIKDAIEQSFEEYLIASGYSIATPTGKPSVVPSYIRAVNKIMKNEGLTWNSLKTNIDVIVALYGKGGAKESEGLEQHETYINALRRFEDFVNNSTP